MTRRGPTPVIFEGTMNAVYWSGWSRCAVNIGAGSAGGGAVKAICADACSLQSHKLVALISAGVLARTSLTWGQVQ